MDVQKNEPIRVLIIVGIVIVIVWGVCWWATISFIQPWDHRSSFGEMFGSVNALFSGAALNQST
jgi:hypothetical protein